MALGSRVSVYLSLAILFSAIFFHVLLVLAAGIDTVNLVTPDNGSWTNLDNDSVIFAFNYSGENETASCMLFIDSVAYAENGSVANYTNTTLQSNTSISEGARNWFVNCTNGTEVVKSEIWTIYVDRTGPNVTLISPSDNYNTSQTSIDFLFNVTDNMDSEMNCSLMVNGTKVDNNASVLNFSTSTFSESGLSPDLYQNWSVICYDNASNFNQSVYRTFNIDQTAPKIVIDAPGMYENFSVNWACFNVTLNEAADWCGYSLNETANQTLSNDSQTHWYENVSGLNEETYNLTFSCNDTLGNMNSSSYMIYFTVDMTYPVMEIILPGNTTYTSVSRTLNYTYVETNVDTCWFEYNTTNFTLSVCGNTTFTALDDQQSNVTLYVNDSSGNLNLSRVYFTVDTTPPVITVDSPTQDQNFSVDWISVNVTLDTAGGWCGYSLNETGNVTMENGSQTDWYANVSSLEDGWYNVTVNCNDSFGNMNSSVVRYFGIDTIYPLLWIQMPANTTYASTARTLNYTYVETNVDTCWYEYNGTNTTLGGCGNTTFTALDNQQSNVTLYINDSSGNLNLSRVYFTVDTSPPVITIDSPTHDQNFSVDWVSLNVTLDTAGGWCGYSLNETANVTMDNGSQTDWYANVSSLEDGWYNVTVACNDTFGNMNSSVVRYFGIDTTYPTISVILPANTSYNSISRTLNYTYVETNVDTCWYEYNGTNTTLDGCGNTTFEALDDQESALTLYINDSAGNVNSTLTNFTVDTTLPLMTIILPQGGSTYNSVSRTLNYTYVETNVDTCWYEYNETNTTLGGCVNTTFTALDNQGSSLTLYINDSAGNLNSSSNTFTVDTLAPNITITAPPNEYNSSSDHLFANISLDQAADWCGYSLNGTANITMSNTSQTDWYVNLSGLNDERYNITFACNDSFGNMNSSSYLVYFTVDTTFPLISVILPESEANYSSTDRTLNYTYAEDNLDTCWYEYNGTNTTLGGCSNTTFEALDNQRSNITLYVNDSAGNLNSSTVFFTVDTIYPKLAIVLPENEANYSSVSRTLNYSYAETNTDTCWYEYNGTNTTLDGCLNITFTALDNQESTLTLYINDSAGHLNSTWVNFSVDTNYPVMEIILPGNTTYNSVSRTLNYTYAEDNLDTCWYGYNSTNFTLSSCSNTSFTALDNQQSNVTLYINDTVGNMNLSRVYFTIDSTPPVITVDNPTQDQNFSVDWVSLNVTLDTEGGWCGYSLNGTANVTMENGSQTDWYANVSSLEDGWYNVTVNCNDSFGNMNSSVVRYFGIDTTYPVLDIVLPENTTYNSVSRTLNYTYTETNVDTCWYEYNGTNTTLGGCVNTTFTALDDQQSNVTLYVNDSSGNLNLSRVYFTVDTTPPVITVTSPVQEFNTSNNWVMTNVSLDQAADWCGYSLNGTANVTMENGSQTDWYANVSSLEDGYYNITFACNDTFGNMNSSSYLVYFTVDTTFPSLSIIVPNNGTTYPSTSMTLNYTYVESNPDTCWYVYNSNTTYISGCSNTTFTGLNNQWSTLELFMNDSSGNENSTNSTFFIDSGAPTITLESPTDSFNYSVNWVWANVSLDEAGGWCGYSLNETTNVSMSNDSQTHWYANVSGLNEELYNITFSCNDTSGNMKNSNTYYFRIDLTYPTMKIILPQNITYNSVIRTLNYTYLEQNVDTCWYEYNLTNTTLDGCSNTTFIALDNQKSNITLYINDSVGHLNSSTREFTIDTTAPIVQICNPVNTTINSDAFFFTYPDGANCSMYSLNGGANTTNCSIVYLWSGTLTGLSDGYNNISVWVNDSVGNLGYNFTEWSRDTTGPSFSIITPVQEYNSSKNWVTYNITLNQAADWCGYSLNGTGNVTMSNLSSTFWYANLTGLNEERYNVTFSCNDTLGNMNSSYTVYFRIDLTSPSQISVLLPSNGSSYSSNARTLNYTWYPLVTDIDTCWYEYNGTNTTISGCQNTTFTALDNQWSTLTLFINDSAGNVNSSTTTFNVDSGPPSISVISPVQGYNYSRNWVMANVTLSEPGSWCGYSLNGTANVSMTADSSTSWYLNMTGLNEGIQNVTFSCNDTSGNMNSSVFTYFGIDTTYPVLSIQLPDNTTYGSAARTLNYSYVETNLDTCWYEYNLTNTTLSGCSNTTFTALDNQQSTLSLYVNDSSGNLNSTSTIFSIDTIPPSITINNPLNSSINQDVFSFSYSDVNCSKYSVNGSANVTNCSIAGNAWSGTLPGLADGFINITVWANDSVGNGNQTIVYWTRDTVSPGIENVTNSSITSSGAVIKWNSTQASNSSVSYGTNASLLSSSESDTSFVTANTVTLSGLSAGTEYYYNVTSCDLAGNCNTSGTYSFNTTESTGCAENWTCSSWSICLAGVQTRTCTDLNSCGTNGSRPIEWRLCSVATSPPRPTPPPEKVHVWIEIEPGADVKMTIDEEGLDLTDITFSVKENAEQVSITVTKLDEKPATVEVNPPGTVYQYVRINKVNLENDNVDKSKIKFRVSKEWIEDNGIDRSTITLMRFTELWESLVTRYLGADADYIFFEADSPGFSYFAISGETAGACGTGERRCVGNELQECGTEGEWITIETCDYGCNSSSLSCLLSGMECTPGERRCVGNELQECSVKGTLWAGIETCDYGCSEDACLPPYSYSRLTRTLGESLTIALLIILMVGLLKKYGGRVKRHVRKKRNIRKRIKRKGRKIRKRIKRKIKRKR